MKKNNVWLSIALALSFFIILGCAYLAFASSLPRLLRPSLEPILADIPLAGDLLDRPACAGPREMLVLAVALDRHQQADVIRLVRVDYVDEKVTALTIPRDFWVAIPDLGAHGISEGRINATYGYGELYLGKDHGMELLARTIEANFGVIPDQHVLIDFEDFAKVIDLIGGVEIVLDQPMDGTPIGLPYMAPGTHRLDGESAMKFARIRSFDSDLQRASRQDLVLKHIFDQLTSSMDVVGLMTLGTHVLTDEIVTTDLSIGQMGSLACLGRAVDRERVSFRDIPAEYFQPFTTQQGASVLLPRPEAARYIQDVMAGNSEN